MICQKLLNSDEDSFRLAMSSTLTQVDKCTFYKLEQLSKRYMMNKYDILELIETIGITKTIDLNNFLNSLLPELNDIRNSLILKLRSETRRREKQISCQDDKTWLINLIKQEW